MRGVYVLWHRQLKRYWRSRGRMIGALGQPLLFLVALGFGFGPIYERAGGGDFIQFLVPGIVSMTILFSSMFNGMEIIWDRQFGFLKETLVAPVSRLSIMIGRTLGGATVSILQGIIVLVFSMLILGYRPHSITSVLTGIFFMFLISMLFTSFGIAIASRLEDMQAFPIIMNFLIMPIFFLSGALFPLDNLPDALEIVTRFNPLTYGVEGVRWALEGSSYINPLVSFSVLAGCFIVAGFIGTYMFSKIEA